MQEAVFLRQEYSIEMMTFNRKMCSSEKTAGRAFPEFPHHTPVCIQLAFLPPSKELSLLMLI